MPPHARALLRTEVVEAKVRQYEMFINEMLKPDLAKASQLKAKLQTELREYEDLERNLRILQKTGQQELKMQVDVGGEVLCQAHVPDVSRVFISIGLGFHLEATLEEAPRVIGERKAALQAKVERALDQCAHIRAHIKMVEQALSELVNITATAQ